MKRLFPKTPSEIFLIGANIIPMIGVCFWEWQVFDIILIFWMENVIIGIINLLKMMTVTVYHRQLNGIIMIPFFAAHYGMFVAVHGIFIFSMFGGMQKISMDDMLNPFTMIEIIQGFEWVLMALFASHLFSFFVNFIGDGEIDRISLNRLMGAPYSRIIALHITIILGGMVVLVSHNAGWALLFLTLIKIFADLIAHRFEHKRLAHT